MRSELDVVRLKRQVSTFPAGSVGTIVVSSPNVANAYLIEFCGPDSTDSAIIEVLEEHLES